MLLFQFNVATPLKSEWPILINLLIIVGADAINLIRKQPKIFFIIFQLFYSKSTVYLLDVYLFSESIPLGTQLSKYCINVKFAL